MNKSHQKKTLPKLSQSIFENPTKTPSYKILGTSISEKEKWHKYNIHFK
jgi:hypothetical protein